MTAVVEASLVELAQLYLPSGLVVSEAGAPGPFKPVGALLRALAAAHGTALAELELEHGCSGRALGVAASAPPTAIACAVIVHAGGAALARAIAAHALEAFLVAHPRAGEELASAPTVDRSSFREPLRSMAGILSATARGELVGLLGSGSGFAAAILAIDTGDGNARLLHHEVARGAGHFDELAVLAALRPVISAAQACSSILDPAAAAASRATCSIATVDAPLLQLHRVGSGATLVLRGGRRRPPIAALRRLKLLCSEVQRLQQ